MNNPMNNIVTTGFREDAPGGTSTPDKGKDGYHYKTVSPAENAAAPRLSRKRLLALETELSDLDWQILSTIRQCILSYDCSESYYHAYIMKLKRSAELFALGEDSPEKFREILERKPTQKTYYPYDKREWDKLGQNRSESQKVAVNRSDSQKSQNLAVNRKNRRRQ